MPDLSHYAIRGGIEGHERLRILARVMHSSTSALFDRVGISPGMHCLDIGCGSGDVAFELAKRVGPSGKVVGADIDPIKLGLAGEEAKKLSVDNVEFHSIDIREQSHKPEFDIVYARFLLTHLSDPAHAVACFFRLLKPNGLVVVEDIDFSGHFVYPASKAFDRYHELYCTTVLKRGGDPNIGPRLPLLLKSAGFEEVGVSVVQPMGLEGDVKLVSPLTMENIKDAAIAEGLTTLEEADEIVDALYAYAADVNALGGLPRVVQAWGRRSAEE